MIEEDTVRQTIRSLIERKEQRIDVLRQSTSTELRASVRMMNECTIQNLEHGIATLIELEHNLRLCGCPEEAYKQEEQLL